MAISGIRDQNIIIEAPGRTCLLGQRVQVPKNQRYRTTPTLDFGDPLWALGTLRVGLLANRHADW